MLAWFDNIYDTILLIYCLDCLLFVCSSALFVRPLLPRSRPQLPNKPYAILGRYVVALIGVVQTLCYIGTLLSRFSVSVYLVESRRRGLRGLLGPALGHAGSSPVSHLM